MASTLISPYLSRPPGTVNIGLDIVNTAASTLAQWGPIRTYLQKAVGDANNVTISLSGELSFSGRRDQDQG